MATPNTKHILRASLAFTLAGVAVLAVLVGLGELAIRRCQHGAVRVIATAKLYQQFAANILARSLLDHHIGQCAKKTQGAAI